MEHSELYPLLGEDQRILPLQNSPIRNFCRRRTSHRKGRAAQLVKSKWVSLGKEVKTGRGKREQPGFTKNRGMIEGMEKKGFSRGKSG
jgi:hypothetical protein